MRRHLTSIAAVSVFALALSASPALAHGRGDSHGLPWTTIASDSTPIAGYPVACGTTNYTVTQGTVDFVERMKGIVDPDTGIASTPGQGIETFTLNDARVRNDATDRTYRVVGQLTVHAAWPTGANVFTLEGVTSFIEVEHVVIAGTRDGRALVVRLRHGAFVTLVDRGTCDELSLQG